jgi:hypothetical protein
MLIKGKERSAAILLHPDLRAKMEWRKLLKQKVELNGIEPSTS